YADELLGTGATPDYPSAMNGLQLENSSDIRGIVAAVDFSTRAINGAVAAKANLLIVHHGMFWSGLHVIQGATYRRLRLLIENDIAVYSSHLPLDRHPTLGNNVLLAKELGLEPNGPFARHESIFIGIRGESEIATAMLVERARKFASGHQGEVRTTPIGKKQITRRWAICTGAGASADTLSEAEKLHLDTLVVGEGPHWTAVDAEETGLTIIYAGHYATETLGVRALAQHLGDKWGIPSSFVSAPSGL
ncbi:MAG: Nif3-like dinuclear metal center hexameric protein, partial [Gemmatimonadaceae bacterium]